MTQLHAKYSFFLHTGNIFFYAEPANILYKLWSTTFDSHHTRYSSRPAHPSLCSGRRSSFLMPPAGPSGSECA